jgi:hypothetical protein
MRNEQNGRRIALAAVWAVAVLFAVAVIYSILRRTETTYNYPHYSSLNNGEQGTKAYFDALARLGRAPSRNFKLLHKLEGSRAGIFYAGVEMGAFRFSEEQELKQFEQLAGGGARMMIAFDPEAVIAMHPEKEKKKEDAPEDRLKTRWGIQLAHVDRSVSDEDRAVLKGLHMVPVNWQFSSWSPAWSPSHLRNGTPLFLERTFGKGSIVLIGNSKLFTNRELLVQPDTDALTAAPGPYRDIVFDESHLGLEDTGTVLGLARAHGLQWMLLGFAGLAILYVWRSSFSFIPRSPAPLETAVGGRDAHAALSNLLMQSVPAESVLRVAAEEWNRSAGLLGRASARTLSADDLARLEPLRAEAAAPAYRDLSIRLHAKMKIHGRREAL